MVAAVTNGTKPRSLDRRPNLASVTTKSRALPNRMLLHAVQKWGKTSFAAQAPSPIFICTRGEDGLDTLIKSGQVGETAHFADPADTWNHLMMGIDELLLMDHPYKTLVIDTINGAEILCAEHVLDKSFGGDLKKYDDWSKGAKTYLPKEFATLMVKLDALREAKNMAIILLAHSTVKPFKNPEGPDYDRWEPVLAKETWALTDRWVDMILFGNFEAHVDKVNKGKTDAETRGKASGGQLRIIHTERHAAFDAGNRYGMPPEIDCGESPKEAWANFMVALHPERNKK